VETLRKELTHLVKNSPKIIAAIVNIEARITRGATAERRLNLKGFSHSIDPRVRG
jgi:two-component sensor histidine kinase